jgi:hypothetical protein
MAVLDPAVAAVPRAKSLLAPIVFGIHLPELPSDPIEYAIQAATNTVPAVNTDRKVLFKGNRKATTVTHQRRILQGRLQNGGYFMRLCDCRPNAGRDEWLNQSQWQLTARRHEDPGVVSEIPPGATAVTLAVTNFRLSRKAIQSTRQLALARYCFVEALKATDPEITVSSAGQTDWHTSWWTDPIASEPTP